MITNENKKLAQWAMEFALKNGCQASRVSIYNGSSSSFEIRDMKMDRLQQASENSLVIHLFVDGRFGSFSTNRLDKKELEVLSVTVSLPLASWRKTRRVRYPTLLFIIKEAARLATDRSEVRLNPAGRQSDAGHERLQRNDGKRPPYYLGQFILQR